MKSLIIAIGSLFTVATSNAADVNVTPSVAQSFKSSFAKASEVKWSMIRNYYQADFTVDGVRLSALFDEDSFLIATTRNISSTDLPAKLQKKLRKEMGNMWITAMIMVVDEKGTTYYTTLENADMSVVLTSNYGSKWSVVKEVCK